MASYTNHINISDTLRSLINYIEDDNGFHQLVYYMKSLKTPPHNGVFILDRPRAFLRKKYDAREKAIITQDWPKPLKQYAEQAKKYIVEESITVQELVSYCFDVNIDFTTDNEFNAYVKGLKFYLAYVYRDLINNSETVDVESCKKTHDSYHINDLPDSDADDLVYVFLSILLMMELYQIKSIDDVLLLERLEIEHNKYGLSDVSQAEFRRQDLCLEGKSYLYNIFLDTSIKTPASEKPAIIELMKLDLYNDRSLFMRCDENTSVPIKEFVSTAGIGFERWRGKDLDLSFQKSSWLRNLEAPIIVEFDPVTLNKLLIKIQPEYDSMLMEQYYNISVEELWNPEFFDKQTNEPVLLNYIHGCLYTDNRFDHIDYSVNQFSLYNYEKKYKDEYSQTSITIDLYGDHHYKVWCLKGDTLDIDLWAKLVYATLSEPFRQLFLNVLEKRTYKI